MKDLIAFCGLDCEACEARIATIHDNDALRAKVAREWSELNHTDITPAMIKCDGCRVDGVKTPFCESMCPIRRCALARRVETCGACSDMESCPTLSMVTGNNPQALGRLREEG